MHLRATILKVFWYLYNNRGGRAVRTMLSILILSLSLAAFMRAQEQLVIALLSDEIYDLPSDLLVDSSDTPASEKVVATNQGDQ